MFSLTFGAGGKDPETGEVVDGWGYYEVSASLLLPICLYEVLIVHCVFRLSQEAVGPAMAGTVLPVSIVI